MNSKIIGYKNNTQGALAFSVEGVGRIFLWESGDMVKDGKGNLISDERFNTPQLRALGLVPVYDHSAVEMAKESTVVKSPEPVKETLKVVAQSEVKEKSELPKNTCWLDSSKTPPEWVFVEDGFRSSSAPGMKAHIKSVKGADYLEEVSWKK
jgi:hypothetical protein